MPSHSENLVRASADIRVIDDSGEHTHLIVQSRKVEVGSTAWGSLTLSPLFPLVEHSRFIQHHAATTPRTRGCVRKLPPAVISSAIASKGLSLELLTSVIGLTVKTLVYA
jgi:hypothetical protein